MNFMNLSYLDVLPEDLTNSAVGKKCGRSERNGPFFPLFEKPDLLLFYHPFSFAPSGNGPLNEAPRPEGRRRRKKPPSLGKKEQVCKNGAWRRMIISGESAVRNVCSATRLRARGFAKVLRQDLRHRKTQE